MAVTGSMGPIYNRSHEHLGTTDALIIRTRRRMINAAKALRDDGITPPGVDNPEIYRQRSGGVDPADATLDWWDAHEGPASRLRRPHRRWRRWRRSATPDAQRRMRWRAGIPRLSKLSARTRLWNP